MNLNRRIRSDAGKTPAPRLAGGYGPKAAKLDAYTALRRIAVTWYLFEEPFYAKAQDTYNNVKELCSQVTGEQLAALAVECRDTFNLRRMPLALARELARLYQGSQVGNTIAAVIRRPDELADFLALYWLDGKCPLSKQVKRGLGLAAQKFDEYQWAKYDGDGAIKLRDVLFLSHAKPKTSQNGTYTRKQRKLEHQGIAPLWALSSDEQLYRAIIDRTLKTPDTWEVALSSGADKKATWLRLLADGKLGDDAFIRNIRNMVMAGISQDRLREELQSRNFRRQMPTQFLAAANENGGLEDDIIDALLRKAGQSKLPGKTIVVVDVSGSMNGAQSGRSEMNRLDAACALAMLLQEACEKVTIYATAGNDGRRTHATMKISGHRGLDLMRSIVDSRSRIGGGGIFVVQVMDYIAEHEEPVDRVLVITDEQDCDLKSATADKATRLGVRNYILNVAPETHGVVTGGLWTRISGFTEKVVDFIREEETRPLFA